jgi:hypothetical protein
MPLRSQLAAAASGGARANSKLCNDADLGSWKRSGGSGVGRFVA